MAQPPAATGSKRKAQGNPKRVAKLDVSEEEEDAGSEDEVLMASDDSEKV